MKILGIESSCDETAAAVVENGRRVLTSIVASQLDVHGKYGGVVPELASREHLRAIVPVVREALNGIDAVDAIAVTQGPGLVGSLLVGITYAKALCYAKGLPLIGVNHIEGHIHAIAIDSGQVALPAVALVVSGGHTHLYEWREPYQYRLLGKTRDDAAGEAFDKVAKLLGLGYPGGPAIDKLAAQGDPHAVPFTMTKMKGNPLDFSFSGIKTAVARWVEEHGKERSIDLAASFQYIVIEELLKRARSAADEVNAESIIIAGGVASNSELRRRAKFNVPVYFPTPALSTDNAAMIAAAAFPKLLRKEFAGFDLKAQANLTLA